LLLPPTDADDRRQRPIRPATCRADEPAALRAMAWIAMDLDQLTYAINGAVFEVNRVLGAGFLEKVYENALLVELKRQGIKAQGQVPLRVSYKSQIVGDYLADLVVDDRVIVELKTVDRIEKIHEAQLLNYLKATGLRVGLLVNFRHAKADIKRLVYDLREDTADGE
jgi:GxxExxY protein